MGQVLYVRPYVDDFSLGYLATSSLSLTCGAMILMYIGEVSAYPPPHSYQKSVTDAVLVI